MWWAIIFTRIKRWGAEMEQKIIQKMAEIKSEIKLKNEMKRAYLIVSLWGAWFIFLFAVSWGPHFI